MEYEILGAKLVEIPYLENQLSDQNAEDSVLIVGERVATEGILQTVLKRPFKQCVCTDIMEMGKDSPLEKTIAKDNRVSFVQQDFINCNEDVKYDYIVCINVLEHFGMNFAEFHSFSGALAEDDYIRWNHDLRAIDKMIALLKDSGKIIITVPCGQPIMSGDINQGNKMPFLRRYDLTRIQLIEDLIQNRGSKIEHAFYYTENFIDWFETDVSISMRQYSQANNPFTPNMIWGFTINKNS